MAEQKTENDVLGETGALALRAAANATADDCDPLAVFVNAMLLERMAQTWDECAATAYLHETEHHIGIRHAPNPYRVISPVPTGGPDA